MSVFESHREDRAHAACARQSSRADAGRRKRGIETLVNA
jgi:hypothetical protein